MGLFTVHFELGEKTRDTLIELASRTTIRVELGPETRAVIERLTSPGEDAGRGVGGLVKRSADVLRSN